MSYSSPPPPLRTAASDHPLRSPFETERDRCEACGSDSMFVFDADCRSCVRFGKGDIGKDSGEAFRMRLVAIGFSGELDVPGGEVTVLFPALDNDDNGFDVPDTRSTLRACMDKYSEGMESSWCDVSPTVGDRQYGAACSIDGHDFVVVIMNHTLPLKGAYAMSAAKGLCGAWAMKTGLGQFRGGEPWVDRARKSFYGLGDTVEERVHNCLVRYAEEYAQYDVYAAFAMREKKSTGSEGGGFLGFYNLRYETDEKGSLGHPAALTRRMLSTEKPSL